MYEVMTVRGERKAVKVIRKSTVQSRKNKTKVRFQTPYLKASSEGWCNTDVLAMGRDQTASDARSPECGPIRGLFRR